MLQILANGKGRAVRNSPGTISYEPPRPTLARGSWLVFAAVLLGQAAFFYYVSQHRLVDDDEGFYLLASRLVLQHRTPYLDFFYTQAPLLPYVFGAWLKLFGVTWFSGRAFCALLATGVGCLMYAHVRRETGRRLSGAVAVLLFASSTLVFAWYPIVKTFALAMLFLFPAYMVLSRLSPSMPGWLVGAAGALFALSVDTRSYIVALAPVLLWWLLRKQAGARLRWLAWFGGGFVIGILPSLILFFASPDAFLFNNLGYHALRSGSGLIGNWHDKMMVVAAIFGGAYTGFQFTALTLIALGLLIFLRPRRGSSLLAVLLAIVLGAVSLLPTPASIQYFSLLMPFLIVAAVCSANDYLGRLQSPSKAGLARALCAALVVAFIAFAAPVFRQYLFTGRKVPGLRDMADAPNWTLERLTQVSQAVDELAQPGEQVLSFFPGYLFATRAAPYPGMENNFGMWVAPDLSAAKREQYHLITAPDAARALAGHETRLVVVSSNQGDWNAELDYAACVAALRAYGYRQVRQIGDIYIYAVS
ncbi:MAG TPA: glycosyltransferase family 39 protein [Terriglobales bacterium]|nr:glycosyltransferase family 39 protein [Terriglobales bacterium]